MLDFSKLTSLAYLMERRPEPDSALILALAASFSAFVLASAAVWVIWIGRVRSFPPLGAVRTRLTRWLFVVGLVGLILIFFRWQGIPYFNSRLWLLLWLVIAGIWGAEVIRYLLKKYPAERRLFVSRRHFERYLPRPKSETFRV